MTARDLYDSSSDDGNRMRSLVDLWVSGHVCPMPLIDLLLENGCANPAEAAQWGYDTGLRIWWSPSGEPFMQSALLIPHVCRWLKNGRIVFEGGKNHPGVILSIHVDPPDDAARYRMCQLILNYLDCWKSEPQGA